MQLRFLSPQGALLRVHQLPPPLPAASRVLFFGRCGTDLRPVVWAFCTAGRGQPGVSILSRFASLGGFGEADQALEAQEWGHVLESAASGSGGKACCRACRATPPSRGRRDAKLGYFAPAGRKQPGRPPLRLSRRDRIVTIAGLDRRGRELPALDKGADIGADQYFHPSWSPQRRNPGEDQGETGEVDSPLRSPRTIEVMVDLEHRDAPNVDLRVSAKHKHDFVAVSRSMELMAVDRRGRGEDGAAIAEV